MADLGTEIQLTTEDDEDDIEDDTHFGLQPPSHNTNSQVYSMLIDDQLQTAGLQLPDHYPLEGMVSDGGKESPERKNP